MTIWIFQKKKPRPVLKVGVRGKRRKRWKHLHTVNTKIAGMLWQARERKQLPFWRRQGMRPGTRQWALSSTKHPSTKAFTPCPTTNTECGTGRKTTINGYFKVGPISRPPPAGGIIPALSAALESANLMYFPNSWILEISPHLMRNLRCTIVY